MIWKRTIVMIGQFASLNGLQLCFCKVFIRYSHFYIFSKKNHQTQYQLHYFKFSFIVYQVIAGLGLINGLLIDWLLE
jgi:hypothetical protein